MYYYYYYHHYWRLTALSTTATTRSGGSLLLSILLLPVIIFSSLFYYTNVQCDAFPLVPQSYYFDTIKRGSSKSISGGGGDSATSVGTTTTGILRKFGGYNEDRSLLAAALYDTNHNDGESSPSLPEIDIRMFLTQCSIQSFLFLLASMRDVHTLKYLDDFTQPNIQSMNDDDVDIPGAEEDDEEETNWVDNDKQLNSRLLQYHGTCAMDTKRFPSWDVYYRELLEQQPKTLTIQPNGLIAAQSSVKEYEIDINPTRLSSRLLSVQNQIRNEFTRDIDIVGQVGLDIFYSYWETVKQKQKQSSSSGADNDNDDNKAFERQSKLFLDWDHYFNPNDDVAPSPFRKGNFDLLYNLVTQESIHRVLQEGICVSGDETGIASVDFLSTFYHDRIESHFQNDLQYGRADDFLEELMLCPPKMITTNAAVAGDDEEAVVTIVNPVTIAEVILKTREKVAYDWKRILSQDFPKEQMEIQKLILDKTIMSQ